MPPINRDNLYALLLALPVGLAIGWLILYGC